MTYNENIKNSIYKWRATHKDQFNAYCAALMKKQYEKNKDDKNKKNLQRYYERKDPYIKMARIFREIQL